MSDKSKIEWTDATWNPLVGCSRVSQGCVNCYAERHAYRFARQPGTVYEGTAKLVNGKPTFTGRVNLNPRALDAPIRWKRPRRIFVNSMSDLFHESVSNEIIAAVFGVMAATPRHTFQVLTKRPARALEWFAWRAREIRSRELTWEPWRVCEEEAMELVDRLPAIGCQSNWPLENVWIGVSVENQDAANERIPLLLQAPAAVRFLSCEPLLGPIDLSTISRREGEGLNEWTFCDNALTGFRAHKCGGSRGPRVDWVIAGGESGPRARPMHPDWARSLRDQCAVAHIPYFFKQWGEWLPGDLEDEGSRFVWQWAHEHRAAQLNPAEYDRRYIVKTIDGVDFGKVGKAIAGRTLDGREHDEMPRAA